MVLENSRYFNDLLVEYTFFWEKFPRNHDSIGHSPKSEILIVNPDDENKHKIFMNL